MEDDDPTPRALPLWVELEYKVSRTSCRREMRIQCSLGGACLSLLPVAAHGHARRTRRVHRIYAPLACSVHRALRRPAVHVRRARSCFYGGGPYRASRMPRTRRARADASAGDSARARMPARSPGRTSALALRLRRLFERVVFVVPFRRTSPPSLSSSPTALTLRRVFSVCSPLLC